jgi:hypothetical protein
MKPRPSASAMPEATVDLPEPETPHHDERDALSALAFTVIGGARGAGTR